MWKNLHFIKTVLAFTSEFGLLKAKYLRQILFPCQKVTNLNALQNVVIQAKYHYEDFLKFTYMYMYEHLSGKNIFGKCLQVQALLKRSLMLHVLSTIISYS